MSFDFGAIVTVISSEATNNLLLSGLEGKIRGFSNPNLCHQTSEDVVVGEIDPNYPIYSVYFPSINKEYWFSPESLELINSTPMEIKIGERHVKRDVGNLV